MILGLARIFFEYGFNNILKLNSNSIKIVSKLKKQARGIEVFLMPVY